ncbi:MAG: hypothetical protein HY331_12110 [Chloroflexi bacterium]|nr:hypothetical protein [Chloroflexota bacterium]
MSTPARLPEDLQPVGERGLGRPMAVDAAVEQTLHYADIFDYPLTPEEMHRFLIGVAATPESLARAIRRGQARRLLEHESGYVFLRGRAHLLDVRRRRWTAAQPLWQAARHFSRLSSALPFVRMVAVTGALAMNNVEPGDDVDLMIVTAPERLWLCRGLVVLIARFAVPLGFGLCPNYLVTTDRLELADRNCYTAHELVQMVPLHGSAVYRRLWDANPWLADYLPNAQPYSGTDPTDGRTAGMRALVERVLAGPVGDRLERWEQQRKIRRLTARATREGGSTAFSPRECRGHFADHGRRVMDELARRSREWRG